MHVTLCSKSSLNLISRLRGMIEENIAFSNLTLFLDPLKDLLICSDSEITLRKKSSLEKYTAIRVVRVVNTKFLLWENLPTFF